MDRLRDTICGPAKAFDAAQCGLAWGASGRPESGDEGDDVVDDASYHGEA